MNNERTLPKAWKKIDENYGLLLGNSGIEVISYIQTVGTKYVGYGYIDNVTNKLYRCINTTEDTDVTTNFELATNIDNNARLSAIEQRLGIYIPSYTLSALTSTRDENSSSPTLTFSYL